MKDQNHFEVCSRYPILHSCKEKTTITCFFRREHWEEEAGEGGGGGGGGKWYLRTIKGLVRFMVEGFPKPGRCF